jgi:anti-anti-sigma factor
MPVSGLEMTSPTVAAAQVLDLGTLTIRSRRDGAAHVLTIAGELDVASAPGVEAELRCIERATALLTSIVVDLRGLTFIDSTGLRLLVEANHRARGATYALVLRRPPDRVFRVCQIAGIDTLLPFQPAPAEADA